MSTPRITFSCVLLAALIGDGCSHVHMQSPGCGPDYISTSFSTPDGESHSVCEPATAGVGYNGYLPNPSYPTGGCQKLGIGAMSAHFTFDDNLELTRLTFGVRTPDELACDGQCLYGDYNDCDIQLAAEPARTGDCFDAHLVTPCTLPLGDGSGPASLTFTSIEIHAVVSNVVTWATGTDMPPGTRASFDCPL